MRRALPLLALVAAGCPGPHHHTPGDPMVEIAALPGVTNVLEEPSPAAGVRLIDFDIEQPVDHDDPSAGTFLQRAHVWHRGWDRPTILNTDGYFLGSDSFPSEPQALLDANEIEIEHRYFTPSRPSGDASWSFLTIKQAAEDHHHLAQLFRPLYSKPWISTGQSKGGMTSVYHHRFHPEDVEGTVAYVAPLSHSEQDPRYVTFLQNVGDSTCRTAITSFRRQVLIRRSAMKSILEATYVTGGGYSFNLIGEDQSIELADDGLSFVFWQYGGSFLCSQIPLDTATDQDVFNFLDQVTGLGFWNDDENLAFEPYYFQAGRELGYPADDIAGISDLIAYPGLDVPANFTFTPTAPPTYDSAAMADIDSWVQSSGHRIIFVYGEDDPWSAGKFTLGNATDSFEFIAPGGNHGSSISQLLPADQSTVLDALTRWTGVNAGSFGSPITSGADRRPSRVLPSARR